MEHEKILKGAHPEVLNGAIYSICTALIEKGLSFRQAEAILELAKERLKDAKI